MAYESRQNQKPSAMFFAEVAVILQKAFPDISITRQVMEKLEPVFTAAWRKGYSARKAVTLSCRRCDDKKGIEPSPAFAAEGEVPKKAVRPPKGAQRGDVFGADELRPPARAERVLREIEVQRDAIARERERAAGWKAKGKSDKAAAAEKRAKELEAVLIELQERLEAEWPEPERLAPEPKSEIKPLSIVRGMVKGEAEAQAAERAMIEKQGVQPEDLDIFHQGKAVRPEAPAEAAAPEKKKKAAAPKAAAKPQSDGRWVLADHTLSWSAQEKRYLDRNFDLMAVVLENKAGDQSVAVPAAKWKGKYARVEYYEGDQAHGQHLVEVLRKQHPGVWVETQTRPRRAAPPKAAPRPLAKEWADVLAPAKPWPHEFHVPLNVWGDPDIDPEEAAGVLDPEERTTLAAWIEDNAHDAQAVGLVRALLPGESVVFHGKRIEKEKVGESAPALANLPDLHRYAGITLKVDGRKQRLPEWMKMIDYAELGQVMLLGPGQRKVIGGVVVERCQDDGGSCHTNLYPEPSVPPPRVAAPAKAAPQAAPAPAKAPKKEKAKKEQTPKAPKEKMKKKMKAPATPPASPSTPPAASSPPGEMTDEEKNKAMMEGFKGLASQIAAQLKQG